MISNKLRYLFSYLIAVLALLISGYLLFQHFSYLNGSVDTNDFCSVVFGKGCLVASLSKYSGFLKIPVSGWGLIYLVTLLTLICISNIFGLSESQEFVQIAFWISLAGIFFSIFFLILMILNPALFCPFCAIFHLLNILLFISIKGFIKQPISSTVKFFWKGFNIVFLAKPLPERFNKWKVFALILPIVFGILIYQWILMQEQNVRINKLASYNPLDEIEQFEKREIYDIHLSPEDPILGSVNAPVSLVVFSDFQCPLCKMFASNFKYLIEKNKENLNIRFKYFPLSSDCNPLLKEDMHTLACQAAKACEAARAQNKFWEYHDALFSLDELKSEEQLFSLAGTLNLSIGDFMNYYNSPECQKKINEDIIEGNRLKIDGTPTVFFNGRKVTQLTGNNINFLIKFLSH